MQPELRYSREEEAAQAGETPEAPEAAPTPFHAFAQNIGARRLMIAIVAMPFFFILLLVAIIAVVGLPEDEAVDAAPLEETAAPDAATAPAPAETVGTAASSSASSSGPALGAPLAAAPGSMALDGDRLAVRVERPEGAVIVIYDLSQGAVVHEIPLEALGGGR